MRRKTRITTLYLALAGLAALSTSWRVSAQPQPALAFENGLLFDGTAFQPRSFFVVDGKLTSRRPAEIDRTIDLQNRYVVPPLGDAHQHIFNSPGRIAEENARFLEAGVFYVMVQDAIGPVAAEVRSQAEVDVSYTWAPVLGPGHGLVSYFRSLENGGSEDSGSAFFHLLRDRADLESEWPRIEQMNTGFIKVILAFSEEYDERRGQERFYSDPELRMARPGLPPGLLAPLVERARRAGKRVSVHVETAQDFRLAVEAGADMIAHLPGWHIGPTAGFEDESLDHWLIAEEAAALAAAKGTTVVTTTYPKPFLDNAKLAEGFRRVHCHNLRLLRKHQVNLVIGTDNGEATSLDEVEHLASLGCLDNLALLRMLVEATPRSIFPDRQIGCLEDGCEASFLVLEANPLDDLSNLGRIASRVKDGRILPPVVRFEVTHLSRSVYLVRAQGQALFDNTVASAGPDGVLLVDTGFLETEAALRRALKGISEAPVRMAVNTHYHHANGNGAFSAQAVTIAHANTRARMERETKMYGRRPVGPWPQEALPGITFEKSLRLYFNDDEIDLLHFPNVHTDGDVVVFFRQANVVATGDFFVPLLGPCDLANGCQWTRFREGLSRLLEVVPKDAKIAPGHGPLSSYADLVDFQQMISEVTGSVAEQIREGRSLEEIQDRGLPRRWRPWAERGISADFFLANVYQALTAPDSDR